MAGHPGHFLFGFIFILCVGETPPRTGFELWQEDSVNRMVPVVGRLGEK